MTKKARRKNASAPGDLVTPDNDPRPVRQQVDKPLPPTPGDRLAQRNSAYQGDVPGSEQPGAYQPTPSEAKWATGAPCELCGAPMRQWQPIEGGPMEWGNSARPLGLPGARCCDQCNATKVIPARLAWAGEGREPAPERARLPRVTVPGTDPGQLHRAADVADFRAWLVRQWQPGGPFHRAAHSMARTARGRLLNKGGSEVLATDAEVELRTLHRAALYYVEPNMVDLLATVAPGCPDDVRPTDLVWPADDGLVALAKPVHGTASDTGAPVEVWAFTWSRTRLRSNLVGGQGEQELEAHYGRWVPCLSVGSYRLVDFDAGLTEDEMVQVADLLVAGTMGSRPNQPVSLHGKLWTPMGRSDWPLDDHLADPVTWALDAAMATSIIEDRRMVTALFTCLAQQGLASQVAQQGARAEVRRLRRSGIAAAEPAKVTIVTLRQPRKLPHAEPAPPGATLRTHRWLVREHPRWQPCGPGRKERRLTIVPAHIKGPPGAPLVIKTRVHRWVR